MKMKLKTEVKIGIYAIVVILAMYWAFNFLKGKDIFSPYDTYYATYENVDGLTASSTIYLRGLKVGSISKIIFEKEKQQFAVSLRIERGYSIPENSVAEIYATDILGNKAIRILMGNSPKLATPQAYLKSNVASDMTNLMASELLPLKEKLDVLLTNLNITVEAVNSVLTEKSQRNLAQSIESLHESLLHVEQITGTLAAGRVHIDKSLENMDAFTTSLRNNTGNIDAIATNLAQFSDSLRRVEINATVDRLNLLLAQASDTTGTVGQLLHNKELYRHLSHTLRDLDILIQDIRENPKKYIKLSIF
jgi:phospholipid/cholesterol/gamma-HCH transport system substrate-binding protein